MPGVNTVRHEGTGYEQVAPVLAISTGGCKQGAKLGFPIELYLFFIYFARLLCLKSEIKKKKSDVRIGM